jgi:hypothetical protein
MKQNYKCFENKEQRKTYGAKKDEVSSQCRVWHNEKLSELYSYLVLRRPRRFGSYRACCWTQGSSVQTLPRTMDF